MSYGSGGNLVVEQGFLEVYTPKNFKKFRGKNISGIIDTLTTVGPPPTLKSQKISGFLKFAKNMMISWIFWDLRVGPPTVVNVSIIPVWILLESEWKVLFRKFTKISSQNLLF